MTEGRVAAWLSAGFGARDSLAYCAIQPRCKSFERHDNLAVPGDNDLAPASRHGTQHLTHRLLRAHNEPCRNGILGSGVKFSPVIGAADSACHKPGSDPPHSPFASFQ